MEEYRLLGSCPRKQYGGHGVVTKWNAQKTNRKPVLLRYQRQRLVLFSCILSHSAVLRVMLFNIVVALFWPDVVWCLCYDFDDDDGMDARLRIPGWIGATDCPKSDRS